MGVGCRRKRFAVAAVILCLLVAFLLSPLARYPLSLAVMGVYSDQCAKESVMTEKGIELEIPGGRATDEKDWYPFVMNFSDSAGFRQFIGEAGANLDLTILYNFPAFDLWRGCSALYDPDSPYYSSFYGAYLVSGQTSAGLPYGFQADGSLALAATAQVPQFDLQRLVLADFGLGRQQMVFDWTIEAVQEDVSYVGSDGWVRVDAALTVNGMIHEPDGFQRSYLQYGPCSYKPANYGLTAFAPVQLRGRLYGKYFAQWETSIFFYVLAQDAVVLKACDREILSKSVLRTETP